MKPHPSRSARKAFHAKTLVVAPSWIGDTLMMQPLLMRLHQREADISIHVLAPAWSAPLLARMPQVAGTLENPFTHGEFDWRGRRALGRRLTDHGFSAAYVLPNSWKSALIPWFAGIPRRIGYRGEMRFGLLNVCHAPSTLPRLVDRYAALAGTFSDPTPNPRLTSTPIQQATARAALGLPAAGTVPAPVIFCPGAEYGPAKRWPARHFAALAGKLAQNDMPVWLLGSDKDAPVGDEIVRLSGGAAHNLCGKTTLAHAIDLIASARAVITNDSGLMHVAAALDRPTIALYGSSSPAYTPPLSERATVLSLGLDCSPCFKRVCPLGRLRCLDDLTPERVFATIAP